MLSFIVYWVGIFLLLILVCVFVLRKARIYRLWAALAVAHLMLMCLVALSVDKNIHDGQARLTWLIADLLDFPISIFLRPLKTMLAEAMGEDFRARIVLAPLLFHGVLGSLQFAGIGVMIHRYWSRFGNSQVPGG